MDYERNQEIGHRVYRSLLLTPHDEREFLTNAAEHHHVETLRIVLAAVDEALEAEGVDKNRRDRVIYRVIYGHAPTSVEPDWDEGQRQHTDRFQHVRHSLLNVPSPPPVCGRR